MKKNPKSKSKAIILAADGAGGMMQVEDRRFEGGEWPIRFEVPLAQSDTWLKYLSTECSRRGWSRSSMGQMNPNENSGSLTISTGGPSEPQLAIVWERKRGGPIKIRARSATTPEFPTPQAEELFQQVNERCQAGVKEWFYCRGQLQYEGLPWRGELWLNDTLRLGPPSKCDETALIGPRIILVDARVAGIDWQDAASAFQVMLRELSVFLCVVLRTKICVGNSNGSRTWTWTADSTGQVECEVRTIGYWERDNPPDMPIPGQAPPVPRVPTLRPDFSLLGIFIDQVEEKVPADITDLWQAFTSLPLDLRQQFLQVTSLWQLALSLGHEYKTASFSFMVVACEALKPLDQQFRKHNIYQVIGALLGKRAADLLQEPWFRPQNVRNAHLHAGEFLGSEFVQHTMMPSFQDPTFDQTWREMAKIGPAAIIEWLRRGGVFTMPPLKRKKKKTGVGI